MHRLTRAVYALLFTLSVSTFSVASTSSDWQQLREQASGQTVYFNAWGGDPAVNSYLDWVSQEMHKHYAITLKIVRLSDAAQAVKRIQSEAAAGRNNNGSVDLLWVNGENFHTLKQGGLLTEGWAENLPNWQYVDIKKPVREDFSEPVDGAEAPWGSAQLMFIGDQQRTKSFRVAPVICWPLQRLIQVKSATLAFLISPAPHLSSSY